MTICRIILALACASITMAGSAAYGQFGYHIDHHNHVMRDRHGHIIGRYHHDVIHRDAVRVVPHYSDASNGTYYRQGNQAYYYPQTAMLGSMETPPVPQEISFGGYGHVDDLAMRLEVLMNELCLDLYYNYSHNPGFLETYSEAYSLLETAQFIHAAEHNRDRDAIASRLGGADALFHHVEDDVRGWTRNHQRQIGTLGILSKLDMSESVLHHLMNDVGVKPTLPEQAPAPPAGPELAPPPSALQAR